MAPTEVLAEQHALGVRALLEGFTVPASDGTLFGDRSLRSSCSPTARRRSERQRHRSTGSLPATVDIAIGTHALIQEKVSSSARSVSS